jgi:S1-C subfamily serine protease
MHIAVRSDTTVRFRPEVQDARLVEIRDPDGAMARAGLRDGDMIVGVDGEEFKDSAHANALLTVASKRDAATLSVIRGGRLVELRVRVADFWGGRDSGGRLVPTSR